MAKTWKYITSSDNRANIRSQIQNLFDNETELNSVVEKINDEENKSPGKLQAMVDKIKSQKGMGVSDINKLIDALNEFLEPKSYDYESLKTVRMPRLPT